MAWSRSAWIAVALCGAGAGSGLQGCAAFSPQGRDAQSPEDAAGLVGNPAPDFSVKAVRRNGGGTGDRSGSEVQLGSLHGSVVLVDFWGTFCGPCKKSFPRLQEIYSRYGAKGLRIVALSEDEAESLGKIPGFADAYGAHFPIAWDEDKAVARLFKLETMPSSFLIDRRGVVRFVHAGYHEGEEAQLQAEIEELLGR